MKHFWVKFREKIIQMDRPGRSTKYYGGPLPGCVDGNTRDEALARAVLTCGGEVKSIDVLPFPAEPQIYAAQVYSLFCEHPEYCKGQDACCAFGYPCPAHDTHPIFDI
jgi:hypothetical protein